MKNRKGFTLIELLLSMTITAVLVSLLTPVFYEQIGKSQKAVCEANRHEFLTSFRAYQPLASSDFTLYDAVNSTDPEITNALEYERAGMVCPSGGTITVKDGKLWCSVHGFIGSDWSATDGEPGNGGDNTGGDNTGGSTGGDNTGGDNTGGDNTGGDNTGGDNTGGDNTGGGSTGGDNTGGDNTGGDNTGGGNTGGDNTGGNTGGDNTGGGSTGGDNTGGDNTGGDNPGGGDTPSGGSFMPGDTIAGGIVLQSWDELCTSTAALPWGGTNLAKGTVFVYNGVTYVVKNENYLSKDSAGQNGDNPLATGFMQQFNPDDTIDDACYNSSVGWVPPLHNGVVCERNGNYFVYLGGDNTKWESQPPAGNWVQLK